jgi:serine-type D-Ala-D-Ala carboxypeptidase/endopeptidase (penicillin-binding protein 4)
MTARYGDPEQRYFGWGRSGGSATGNSFGATVVLAVLLCGPTMALAADLAGRLNAALAPGRKAEVVMGIRVLELPGGQEAYALNADKAFTPASNMKLVTTAAALDLLGLNFRYRTVLAHRGDDLLIVGAGDPGTGDPRLATLRGEPITAMFHKWADALKAAGLTEIRGQLLFDDSIFDSTWINPGWNAAELDTWYAAPVGGLVFNDSCVDVRVSPGPKPGEPLIVEMTPPTRTVQLINNSRTGGNGTPLIRRKPREDVLLLSGQGSKRREIAPVAVHDPGLFFAGACREALVAKGIRLGEQIKRVRIRQADGSLPAEWKVIATHETPLVDVASRCNKYSQNLFAECMLKTLGYYHGQSAGDGGTAVGSWTTGRVAVRKFMMKAGLPPYECVIDDGSGLSHDNRLTPTHLTNVLRYMYNHPGREQYVHSLAVSGKEGTVKKRMKDISGQVYAKTGYVAGARTLSGYVSDRGGKRWACFSILVNGVKGGTRGYADIQDEVVRIVAQWLEAQPGGSSRPK